MSSSEKLSSTKEAIWSITDSTKKSLSLLEKETRINFFKKAENWIKNLFWIKSDTKQETTEQHSKSQFEQSSNTDKLKVSASA